MLSFNKKPYKVPAKALNAWIIFLNELVFSRKLPKSTSNRSNKRANPKMAFSYNGKELCFNPVSDSNRTAQPMANISASTSSQTQFDFDLLESIIDYPFQDRSLLLEAFTHSSKSSTKNYERLEFLGDSILHFLVGYHCYSSYSDFGPGELTDLKRSLVDKARLSRAAVEHDFDKFLMLDDQAFASQIETFLSKAKLPDVIWNESPKVLSDMVEAVIGAIFLDTGGNLDKVWEVLKRLLDPMFTPDTLPKDPVAELQQLCQRHGVMPEYSYSWNQENDKTRSSLKIKKMGIETSGESSSQKNARKIAAQKALLALLHYGNCPGGKTNAKTEACLASDFKKNLSLAKENIQTRKLELSRMQAKYDLDVLGHPRAMLNECCAKLGWDIPSYTLVEESGMPNDKLFTYTVTILPEDGQHRLFTGSPKKGADRAKDAAAKIAIPWLGQWQ